MNSSPLEGFLRLGVFLGGCGLLMLFVQPPDSPQFVLSACSGLLGLTLVLGVVILTRIGQR